MGLCSNSPPCGVPFRKESLQFLLWEVNATEFLKDHRCSSLLKCGNPGCSGGVAMGAGQHRGSTGTSEPDWRGPVCNH